MPTVYASVPLSGTVRRAGRELLREVELALERAGAGSVELVAVDTGGQERVGRAEDAARQAAEDHSALAYVGDFNSDQVAASSRILGPPACYRSLRSRPGPTSAALRSCA